MVKTLNFNGQIRQLDMSLIMGIINVNQDSFYAASRKTEMPHILNLAESMVNQGADMVDVGAMSSRPGAEIITEEDEMKRIIPAVEAIIKEFPGILISVDTMRSKVASAVIDCGASCINDISGGTFDAEMMRVVAHHHIPYIIMHMQGMPAYMQLKPQYNDVVLDIMTIFSDRIRKARAAGILDVIIDPGFGFGKTLEQNYHLIREMEAFQIFDVPILAGISRKSMIWKPLGIDADHALNGTTALHMALLNKGVNILRVHDVKEAVECVKLFSLLNS
jgi:dihydropteroate synthase